VHQEEFEESLDFLVCSITIVVGGVQFLVCVLLRQPIIYLPVLLLHHGPIQTVVFVNCDGQPEADNEPVAEEAIIVSVENHFADVGNAGSASQHKSVYMPFLEVPVVVGHVTKVDLVATLVCQTEADVRVCACSVLLPRLNNNRVLA
jgi:hypothetical protein